jgi:cyanate permease
MAGKKIVAYHYRWVILFGYMILMALQQLLWINFANITVEAAKFYNVSEISIGLLSMVFMIAFVFVSIPCSWLIDTFGFRFAVGLGAVITGVFGLLRGIFAGNFIIVFVCQMGIALAQPLIINAVTRVSSKWFPIGERATAGGLAWLGAYAGIIVGLTLTPYLYRGYGIQGMLLIYGVAAAAGALFFLFTARENPPTPQSNLEQDEKTLVFDGLRKLLAKREFIFLMLIFFIGLGAFNALATWLEEVVKPRGFSSEQAGIMGGIMVASGIVGSAVVPMLSDKLKNRSRFILLAVAGSVPGLLGIAFSTSYPVILASSAVLGFFLLSTAPIGFQYGAEISYPAPGGTSTGVLMMMGQVSGIAFIFGMDLLKSPSTGSMTLPMIVMISLMIICIMFTFFLKETNVIERENE